jgi:hypothetical protein
MLDLPISVANFLSLPSTGSLCRCVLQNPVLTLSSSSLVVADFRMKHRMGKLRAKKLELVLAQLAELLCLSSSTSTIDSRRRPSPSGGCSRIAGDGGSGCCCFTQSLCIPVPR